MLRKIIDAILIIVTFISNLYILPVSAAAPSWDMSDIYHASGTSMPFSPEDKYTSEQNPPDFTWPYALNAAEYELKICYDRAMTSVYKSVTLKNNYYNFPEVFEKGVNYYWSVRYKTTGGIYSEWSDVRRFRIDPDAVPFVVPSTEQLISKIPVSHPRFLATPETLEAFREYKNIDTLSKELYEEITYETKALAAANTLPALPFDTPSSDIWDIENNTYFEGKSEEYQNEIWRCEGRTKKFIEQLYNAGLAYLLSGDEQIGNYSKKVLLAAANLNINGTTSYTFDDRYHFLLMTKMSIVYDWLYTILTPEERTEVQAAIKERMTHVYTVRKTNSKGELITSNLSVIQLLDALKKSPYDSHGWGGLAHVLTAAFACCGDFPEATEWFQRTMPLYAADMFPWSNQDGGWSQGTDYWQYSTDRIIWESLKTSGVIDLYSKAYERNQPLWSLYAYPAGSFGSFGDQSGRTLSNSSIYSADMTGKTAFVNNDPLARWLCNQQGGLSKNSYNYHIPAALNVEEYVPYTYPLSHHFKDIGWTVMTNDLINNDRIQMTFKSSPYGSYNHSQPDQNSFYLQAFGQKLAVRTGYYDYYHSPHDSNITRLTSSHNSVTVNGGYGQTDNNFYAAGNIIQFTNHLEFDSVTGEAAKAYIDADNPSYCAYDGNLGCFDRNMIYLRPGVFLVIDDLKGKSNSIGITERNYYDWWLNSESDIEYTDNTALIKGVDSALNPGDARLKATVAYPAVTPTYYDGSAFVNPINKKTYNPTRTYGGNNVQRRLCFSTAKTRGTKIVVSMSVYQEGSAENTETTFTQSTSADGKCLTLSYSDGTTVYVNLADKSEKITTDTGIEFIGTAVSVKNDSVMLTNGTYLKTGGKVILESPDYITAAIGLGEICLSADDDFTVSVGSDNDYINIPDPSRLRDSNGRALSNATGITAVQTGDLVTIDAQKGDYTLVIDGVGVDSVGKLKVFGLTSQSREGKYGAVYWNASEGRHYDVKVNDTVYEDVSSPYRFEITDNVDCIYVREKIGSFSGEWSDPVYVSKLIKEKRDSINYNEFTENGKSYIKTEIYGFPQDSDFNIYTAAYAENGIMTAAAKGTLDSDTGIYTATIEKPAGTVKVQSFMLGNNIEPLTPAANFGSGNTNLKSISLNGVPLSDFDNAKDFYEYAAPDDWEYFPYVSAEAEDSSTAVDISYDFSDFSAVITITAENGDSREINIKLNSDSSVLHPVTGASDPNMFTTDSGTYNGMVSKSDIGTITSILEDDTEIPCPIRLYTNLKGYNGSDDTGSRLYSNITPNSGNHLGLYSIPKELEGFDYLAFDSYNYFRKLDSGGKSRLEFELEKDAIIYIFTDKYLPCFSENGFSSENYEITAWYMNGIGPEDKYYNVKFMGVPDSDITGGNLYCKTFDLAKSLINVSPIDSYKGADNTITYNNYLNGNPGKDEFTVLGTTSSIIVPVNRAGMILNRCYSKNFDKGRVSIDIEGIYPPVNGQFDDILVVIAPKMPKPFYQK